MYKNNTFLSVKTQNSQIMRQNKQKVSRFFKLLQTVTETTSEIKGEKSQSAAVNQNIPKNTLQSDAMDAQGDQTL